MNRISLLMLPMIVGLSGCAHSLLNHSAVEERVITEFADALREENEPALRRIASTRFEEKALRSDDVLTDLRVLRLPTSELSVVEVKDITPDRREVIAKEESGGKYQFHLVNDPAKNYWTVDDVLVRQRSKGTQITKSTTEVMDLLMTLREFLDVWEQGSRDEILAMMSPDLAASLEPLPEEWLKALTQRIASTYEEGMARKPEANLDEEDAVVKLPTRVGHLMIRITRDEGRWLIDDVEAHSRREENYAGSIRRQADAMNAVNQFLTAYGAKNHDQLKSITTEKFYSTSLDLADLSLIQLPGPEKVPTEFDIRAYENLLTFMLPAGREVVRLDLEEQISEIPDVVQLELTGTRNTGPRFLVREVTLYDKGTDRQRSLSAVFTAPTRASLFLKALQDRDHEMLTQVSTGEFAKGTWQRATPDILSALPIPNFYDEGMKLTNSHSIGNRTELEFTSGNGGVFTCSMVNQNGFLRVDDIQYPSNHGQVTSLKNTLELSIPIQEFRRAWAAGDMEKLQKSCSSDFNRLVWSHLQARPGRFSALPRQMSAPLIDTRVTLERATVRLGDGQGIPTVANLIQEHGFWVVDEVQADEGGGRVIAVREALRGQIAAKLLKGSYSTVTRDDGYQQIVPIEVTKAAVDMTDAESDGLTAAAFDRWASSATMNDGSSTGVRPASAGEDDDMESGRVDHAVYRRYADGDGSTTSESGRVTPAVFSQDVTDGRSGSPQAALIPGQLSNQTTQAGRRPRTEAPSISGVQVFGPQAAKVAAAMAETPTDYPGGSAAGLQSNPGPIPVRPSTAETDSGVMYFGPDRSRELHQTAATPVAVPAPKGIRQPADAPIAIE
ncbi:MAG: hypothetical protein R3C49_03845 [Planctomycetaceae bacterium]